MKQRIFKIKQCALCPEEFRPTSGTAKYCPECQPKIQKEWRRAGTKRYYEKNKEQILNKWKANYKPAPYRKKLCAKLSHTLKMRKKYDHLLCLRAEGKTYQEIADYLGYMSRQRVEQIVKRYGY